MQITINIPKEFENHFNSDKFEDSLQRIRFDIHKAIIARKDILSGNYEIETLDMLTEAFLKGKPLPKGHGRLGDLDALEDYFRNVRKELKASDYKNGTEFFVRDEMLLNFQQFIHLCDAIIEGSDAE